MNNDQHVPILSACRVIKSSIHACWLLDLKVIWLIMSLSRVNGHRFQEKLILTWLSTNADTHIHHDLKYNFDINTLRPERHIFAYCSPVGASRPQYFNIVNTCTWVDDGDDTGRCRYNEVNCLQIPHNKHSIARPWRAVKTKSDLCSTSALKALYVILCCAEPRHNGTRL